VRRLLARDHAVAAAPAGELDRFANVFGNVLSRNPSAMETQRPWHRLFGLSLVDFFRGMPVTVELEKDLSLKQQLLDVVIIRKQAATLPSRLPDGFEDQAAHNLVTFKSYQEALDGWALNELIGHYVNYRKQASESMQDLLPETDFRLFAVSVRFPQGLARSVPLTRVQPGVYDVQHFTGLLRLVVVHELPQQEHNSLLHLFSARMDLLKIWRDALPAAVARNQHPVAATLREVSPVGNTHARHARTIR
jgi:hypothetical protein